jgi:hypothetical protein
MPENDISSIVNTNTRFIKDSHRRNVGLDKTNEFYLKRAVVVDINRNVNQQGAIVPGRPPYSVAAVILGETIHGNRPDLAKDKIWYPPLSSMHNISIPEIGEEVFIIKESNAKSSIGYWVGRVNNSTKLDFYAAKSWAKGATSAEKFGGRQINVDAMHDKIFITPGKTISQSAIPFRDGDVLQQGRSGTFVRHSFHPTLKGGVLEMGISTEKPKVLSLDDPTIGFTKTKTVHLEFMSIKDIMGDYRAIIQPIKKYENKDEEIDTSGLDSTIEGKNIIANLAQEHYNISIDSTGESIGDYLYRQVLGERNKETISSLIEVVKDLKESVIKLHNDYKNHKHGLEGFNFRHTQNIGEDGGLVDVNFSLEDREVDKIRQSEDNIAIAESLSLIDDQIKDVEDKLEKTLSESQYIQ